MCEGPEAGKSWVFIGNKEKQYCHSPGKGKISRWKVSSDQIVQVLEGPGELCQLGAEPVGSLRSSCLGESGWRGQGDKCWDERGGL